MALSPTFAAYSGGSGSGSREFFPVLLSEEHADKRRGARTFSKTHVAAAVTFLEGHLRKRSSSKIIIESGSGGER